MAAVSASSSVLNDNQNLNIGVRPQSPSLPSFFTLFKNKTTFYFPKAVSGFWKVYGVVKSCCSCCCGRSSPVSTEPVAASPMTYLDQIKKDIDTISGLFPKNKTHVGIRFKEQSLREISSFDSERTIMKDRIIGKHLLPALGLLDDAERDQDQLRKGESPLMLRWAL